jgi:hypothetical protein
MASMLLPGPLSQALQTLEVLSTLDTLQMTLSDSVLVPYKFSMTDAVADIYLLISSTDIE